MTALQPSESAQSYAGVGVARKPLRSQRRQETQAGESRNPSNSTPESNLHFKQLHKKSRPYPCASALICGQKGVMRSEKQIQASKANGARSRGPITAEGKRN